MQINSFSAKGFACSLFLKVRVFGTLRNGLLGETYCYDSISAGVHIINMPGAKRGIAIIRNGSAWFWCLF